MRRNRHTIYSPGGGENVRNDRHLITETRTEVFNYRGHRYRGRSLLSYGPPINGSPFLGPMQHGGRLVITERVRATGE